MSQLTETEAAERCAISFGMCLGVLWTAFGLWRGWSLFNLFALMFLLFAWDFYQWRRRA